MHSGVATNVTVRPAAEGFGLKFKRKDLDGDVWIPADPRFVCSTYRNTSLKSGNSRVDTVEHLLAALFSLGISNAEIEVEGPELPALDGTIGLYFQGLKQIGVVDQSADKPIFRLTEPIHFKCPDSGAEYMAFPSDDLDIQVQLTYPGAIIGEVLARHNAGQSTMKEIGLARTFVEAKDIIELANNNMIKGGDLSNAVVLNSDDIDLELLRESINLLGRRDTAEIMDQIKLGVNFRYPNEPARHKLADLIGDLALLGSPIHARIIAIAPGHTGNVAFVKQLKELFNKQIRGVPRYDPSLPPVVDAVGLMNMLPHRYPFLLVDKIIELTDNYVVGVKNLTMNEMLFQGHFPGNPVFPGVLQMEAMAQTGGILVLSKVDIPADWDTYFLKMDQVKFKRKVGPGDTLVMKLELLEPIRRGIVHMKGTAYVNDKIVSEGDLTAQIVDRTKQK